MPPLWDHLLTDCRAATMRDGDLGRIEDAAIAIAGDRIAWIGKRADLPAGEARCVHRLAGRWVTPGLVDCHTHLVYAGDRAGEFAERQRGVSYEEIARRGGGIFSSVAATRAADEETLARQALTRLDSLIAEGVTAIEIKSGYGLDLANETKQLRVARRLGRERGIAVRTTCLAAHVLPPEFAGRAEAYIEAICRRILPALVAENLVDAVDGFCERIAFAPAEIDRLFRAARELGLPVKLHADQLSDSGGAALAARHGALSADHLEYADEAGIAAMAKAGSVAVLLPGAFYALRETKLPPIDLMRRAGTAMAIASDHNPGTSPALSLLLMANMACTLFRLTAEEALLGLTIHAAKALGLAGDRGSLAPQYRADLAIWSIGDPAELVYWIGGNPNHAVMAGGNWLKPPA